MNLSSCSDVVIQFEPTGYMVAEGGSTRLRVVKVGVADVPVSVFLSTVIGTAGKLSQYQILCRYQNMLSPQKCTFQEGESYQ